MTAPGRALPALLDGLAATADATPGRAALVLADGATVSFGGLRERVAVAASGLADLGLAPGDRVVLLVPVGTDFVVAAFALLACGAVPVLVDPGIGLRRVRHALAQVAPVAFVGSGRAHLARLVLRWAPSARRHVLAGGGVRSAWLAHRTVSPRSGRTALTTLAQLEREGDAGRPWRPQPDDAEAAVLFTSGSTGTPKGVVYRHPHFAAQIATLREVYDLRAGEVNVATFPPFALLGPALGMTTVVPRMDFTRPATADPRHVFAATNDTHADVLFASPALLDVLARHGAETGAVLPSLRLVLSAGAPVPVDLVTRMTRLLPASGHIGTPYGMTEALPVCAVGGDELRAASGLHDPPRGVCVGRPVPGTSVVVAEVARGPVVTPVAHDGMVGEVVVAGPQVTDTYVGRPDAMAVAKTTLDGVPAHRTGDLGWRDAEGRIWFVGRVVHRVPTPSGPLDTLPVEQRVTGHPAVRRAALVAVDGAPLLVVQPHADWWRTAGRGNEPGRDGRWWTRPRRDGRAQRDALVAELRALLDARADTAQVGGPLLRRHFPVDARHNAKVGYEQLGRWAAANQRGRWMPVGRRAFGGAAT